MSAEMTATTLRWTGGTLFETAGEDGTVLQLDLPAQNGGSGRGFRPMELLLDALGTCMATTLVLVLAKQRIVPDEYQLTLRGERAEERPHPFTRIVVEHVLRGPGLTQPNLERLVALVDEKYCSVAATLPRGLIEHRVVIADEAPAGEAVVAAGN